MVPTRNLLIPAVDFQVNHAQLQGCNYQIVIGSLVERVIHGQQKSCTSLERLIDIVEAGSSLNSGLGLTEICPESKFHPKFPPPHWWYIFSGLGCVAATFALLPFLQPALFQRCSPGGWGGG